ncbi:telomere stability silencing [Pyrrhoderma noxium]|uniref:Telomere stability silencing n=1 Tax=Pyrrhoderma noxium TaxID=2282107 RepID=A0A286U951_9AGAM|nr:telomere stability silencing [Pyrrhoderma noxium]
MSTTLLVSTFPPFPSLTLTLPSETPLSQIPEYLPDYLPPYSDANLSFSLPAGLLTLDDRPLSALWSQQHSLASLDNSNNAEGVEADNVEILTDRLITLRLSPRLCGGKGGFGSQLRAAGGRMSSQKTNNNDSCRDLNGRRLSTIKEAKALAAYLESEPERVKAQQEAQRAKLEKLERQLGIDRKGGEKAEGSSAGVKRRFDDTEYIEQSRDIVDNVKSAVVAGMLKKKKKAKTSPPPATKAEELCSKSTNPSSSSPENGGIDAAKSDETERVVNTTEEVTDSSVTTPVATVPSATLAAVGA